jgi:hypothetical protein
MNAGQEIQTSGNNWSGIIPSPSTSYSDRGNAVFDSLETQMAQFQAQSDAVLAEVRKNFILPRDTSVVAFLNEHKSLPEILVDALPQLRSCFGERSIFSLSASLDESGSRTVYAIVMWAGPLQLAKEALAKFDDDWWIERAAKVAGHLTFTYELV